MGSMSMIVLIIGVGIIFYAAFREMRRRVSDFQKQLKRLEENPDSNVSVTVDVTPFPSAKPTGLVEKLTDPKEAAAVLMVQMAAYRGQVSVPEKRLITEQMQSQFDIPQEEAEGLFSFGRMAVGQLGDAAASLPQLLEPIVAQCTSEECEDFLRMMSSVAEIAGRPNEDQRKLLTLLEQLLPIAA